MPPSAQTAGGRRVTRWTRELIIEKILEWDARYGEPPCSADWNPSLARWRAQDWRAERYREGVWPSTNAAKRPFDGSFDAAVRAAGLEPHKPGPRRAGGAPAPPRAPRRHARARRRRPARRPRCAGPAPPAERSQVAPRRRGGGAAPAGEAPGRPRGRRRRTTRRTGAWRHWSRARARRGTARHAIPGRASGPARGSSQQSTEARRNGRSTRGSWR